MTIAPGLVNRLDADDAPEPGAVLDVRDLRMRYGTNDVLDGVTACRSSLPAPLDPWTTTARTALGFIHPPHR